MFELIDYQHTNIIRAIFCSILGMTFRFGVIESLLGTMFIIYIWRSRGINRFIAVLGVFIIVVAAICLWGITGGNVIFEQKTRIYLGEENAKLGTKSFLWIVFDVILKLFGAGPRLHPQEGKVLWISFLGYMSIFNIYVLYWFFINLFQRGKKWKEWFLFAFIVVWMVFLSYLGSIIYRQILFLQPVLWILACKAMYTNHNSNRLLLKGSSIILPFIIYSVMFIYVRM